MVRCARKPRVHDNRDTRWTHHRSAGQTAKSRSANIPAVNHHLPAVLLPVVFCIGCVGPATPSSYEYEPHAFVDPRLARAQPAAAENAAESPAPPAPPARTVEPQSKPLPESITSVTHPKWQTGEVLMQGFLGVSFFDNVAVDGGSGAEVDGDDGDLDQLPLIGGGGQWKLGGERIDMGAELMFSFSGRADAAAFVVTGGGAAVAIDVDLLIFEIYGGPFVSMDLGEKWRLYGAAGPVLQFADYDQSGNGLSDDGSGFGSGFYARTGLEFAVSPSTLIGFGARWSDTTVDLGGDLGDLEVDGLQAVFTVSKWY